jgi:predicted RNA polymerase sigma factor
VTDWRPVRRVVREVLGALVRRYGHLDACEDAAQEALLAATTQWRCRMAGEPPRVAGDGGVASHRRPAAQRHRPPPAGGGRCPPHSVPPAGGEVHPDVDARGPTGDDTLTLLFLCCHPALTPPSQVALTLRSAWI